TKRFIQVYCYPIHVILAMCVIVTVIQVPIAYNWLRFEDEKGEAVLCYQTSQSSMVYIQILFQTVIPAVGIVSLNFWLLAIHQSSAFGLVKSASSSRVRQNLVNLLAMSSIQYLVSMLPMCIYFPNERHFFNLSEKLGKAKAQLTYSLTLLMIYSNNATNFVTYCFFGRRFRIEFLRIIRALTCTGLQSFNLDTPQTISPSITRPTIDYSSAETMTESKVDETKPKVHETRSSKVLHSLIRNVHTNIKRMQTKSRTATIDYSSAETMMESKVDETKPKVHETRSSKVPSKVLHSLIRNVHTNIKRMQTKSRTVTSSVTDLFNAGKMEEMKACETTSRRVREGISSMTGALQAFFRNLHTNIKGIQTKSQT
ncbi:type-1 angiotensin II receptor B, partial [Biomphalaria glabrata]